LKGLPKRGRGERGKRQKSLFLPEIGKKKNRKALAVRKKKGEQRPSASFAMLPKKEKRKGKKRKERR